MKLIVLLTTLIAASIAASITAPVIGVQKLRYNNYSVFNLNIRNKTQLSVMQLIKDQTNKFDIWKEYDAVEQNVHIMVPPNEVTKFKKLMKSYAFNVELLIPDVQKLIEAEQQISPRSDEISFGWTQYYQLHEIEAWLDVILATYPQITEGFSIGQSYEGRTIRGIKISYKAGNPGIFIESNIHAREWITSATATWLINELLTSENSEIRQLAENNDWYIIPVFNVDGFVYTHQTDRMWRKTRQAITTSTCIGADANRNFDTHWMANEGASSDPCSFSYAGAVAFSEPETRALADYVASIKDKIKIYLAFHSYGQYLLSPYGHSTTEFPENYDDVLSIGAAFSKAISDLSYGTKYTYGSFGTVLYVGSGTSVDYAYSEQNIKLGFTIEYRDKGRFGFLLPPVQIIPNCEELMAGLLALVNKSKDLGYL